MLYMLSQIKENYREEIKTRSIQSLWKQSDAIVHFTQSPLQGNESGDSDVISASPLLPPRP